MATCPPNIRVELEEFFEKVLESPEQAICYEVDSTRVDYLYRWARYIKDEAVMESTSFSSTHPRYGKGMWQEIRIIPADAGLYGFVADAVELTNAQILVNAAFLGKEVVLTAPDEREAKKTWAVLKTKHAKLSKRWKGEKQCDALKAVTISLEENRVVVRTSGAPKRHLKPVSLEEAKNVKPRKTSGSWS